MNKLRICVASFALTLIGLVPAAALADDDLDVTMEVLDSVADIDGEIMELRGPDGEGADFPDGERDNGDADDAADAESGGGSEAGAMDSEEGSDGIVDDDTNDFFIEQAERENDFERDDDFQENEDATRFEQESEIDEGEDIDDDGPEEAAPEMDEPMDDDGDDAAG
jgi:hypothetical protein